MLIRPARSDDFTAIAAITNHYIATTAIHFAYDPVADHELCAMWQHQHTRFPWLVAEEAAPGSSGAVVGYAKAGTWRDRVAYSWTVEVGLYVAAHARGQGIGSALYSTLLRDLEIRGFRSAVAGITVPNDASVRLHEKLGFAHVGTFADAGWKHGAWHAVEFWQKRFATGPDGPPQRP
jgi:phosphinothricin acetyltransferase